MFIHARLDDDAQAAQWVTSNYAHHAVDWTEPSSGVLDVGDDLIAVGDAPLARYMARYDPARTLRDIAITRLILAEHPQVAAAQVGDQPTGCPTCHADPDCGTTHGHGTCQTVRLLAAAWSTHPDYRPDWIPQ